MPLIRATARPMLASMFVTGGLDALLHPQGKTAAAATVGPKLAARLPFALPQDPAQLVRINGAVQLAAGLSLATGRMPRLASLVLAGSLIPTTLAGHRFWEKHDKGERRAQQQQFTKNLSMLGGLLIAAVDLEGRPGVRHRGHDAVRELKHASHDASLQAHAAGHRASTQARRLVPVS